ncbi:MAG: hypothetical protein HW421_242 [Ignavibacteria bacterium]|nr:hypothetical protein [Ignavibacteria bacterium]
MPKLYEYLGIIIFFWSDEHEPIHVHGRYQGSEIKAEIIVEEGNINEILIKNVSVKKRFDEKKRKDFEEFVRHFAKQIVEKWVDYFIWKKDIESVIITRKVK